MLASKRDYSRYYDGYFKSFSVADSILGMGQKPRFLPDIQPAGEWEKVCTGAILIAYF